MLGTNCSNTMYVPFSIFSITGCEYKSGKVRKMNLKRTWKGLNSFELTDHLRKRESSDYKCNFASGTYKTRYQVG